MQRPGQFGDAEGVAVRSAIARVVSSGGYIQGAEVSLLESELAQYLGAEAVVGVACGTDALELSLRALGIGAGHRVATVANAGYYATAAISAVGALPVLVDVDAESLQMDPQRLAAALGAGLDAVILTHLFGDAHLAPTISLLCHDAGVPLIEDCAQSMGATIDGVRAGTFGVLSALSFYPTKNLAALGDGGAVAASDPGLAARVRTSAQHGWGRRFEVMAEGRNSRLDELQAAVVRVRLPLLDSGNQRRREIWSRYSSAVEGTGASMVGDGTSPAHAVHQSVVRVERRDEVRARLLAAGVSSDVHYPVPDHRQPLWRERFPDVELPISEGAAAIVLSIPCHPALSDDDVERVAAALRTAVQA